MRRWPVLLLSLPVLAGCAATGGTAASSTSSAASGTASSAAASASSPASRPASSTAGSWGHLAGCPSVGQQIPQNVNTKPTIDVDGDGRPDTAWIARGPDAQGRVPFGVHTASGAEISGAIPSTGSPVDRSVLFADVTGSGKVIALTSDGRQVPLFAVSDCQLIPMKNQQGQQYTFDLGFTGFGTGVGCVDANGDGTPDLVGLKYVPESQGEGTIQRTIVTLDGPDARNGATDTVPATNANMADEAQSVSCGGRTLAADGVSSRS